MKKFLLKYGVIALILFTAAGIQSCSKSKDGDSEKPTICLIKPISMDKFSRGGIILVDADLQDNKELATLELSLSSQKSLKGIDTPWTADRQTQKLNGKEQQIRDLSAFGEIPSDIMSAEYTLTLTVSDTKGNTTSTSVLITIE